MSKEGLEDCCFLVNLENHGESSGVPLRADVKPSTTLWPVVDAVVNLDGHFDAGEDTDGYLMVE